MIHRRAWAVLAGPLALALAGAAFASVPAAVAPANAEAYSVEIAGAKAVMMKAPEEALAHARRAAALSNAASLRGLTAAWLEGEALYRLRDARGALAVLNPAIETAARLKPVGRLQGDLLKAQGQASGALGQVRDALADYQRAYEIYQAAQEPRAEAIALQMIAAVYQQAHEAQQALKYYTQSAEVFTGDPLLNLSLHNNKAVVLRDMGRLDEARREFLAALKIADELDSNNLRAQVLANIGLTDMMRGRYKEARASIDRGLALSRRDAEAASERPFLLGVAAKTALASGDAHGAVQLLDEAFRGVDPARTGAEYRDIHETAAAAYEKVGDAPRALAHQKALKRLDDLNQSLAASASAALVAARFDFANQDLRISRLKQGQLERDISLARSKERLRNVIILALSGGGLIVSGAAIAAFLYMRWSRNRIRAARDQLAVTNTDLERALSAKTDFLAMASHEMRTPLNGILGVTQVLLASRGLEESTRERVSLVHSAGQTMKALVDDLLDLAKGEKDTAALTRAPFPLRSTLETAHSFWRDKASQKNLAFELQLDVPARAVGDQGRLKQVVNNLLSNAIKFTDAGYVRLQADYASGELTVRITDSGIGVAPEDQERIFEPFTQVDCGMARQFGGTGLGLSICRTIARQMGGDIAVESRLGEGACFILRLPLQVSDEPAAAEEDAPCVLLIDANPLNGAILKAAIAPKIGGAVLARTLEDAVSACAASAPELILADAAALGGEDALDAALERLRARWPEARVTLLTPSPLAEGIAQAAAGCDLLLKPISVAAIVDHLSSRRTQGLPDCRRAA